MKVKPNLFIIGAAKSGTTSLYRYLNQHPDIYFTPIKEPNFFSDDIDISEFSTIYKRNTFLEVDEYFKQKNLQELPITFVRNKEYYEQLFNQTNNFKIRGEASTSYLYSRKAAKNIYNFNLEAQIIAILRNPVKRAFSHYLMAVRYGHTKLALKKAVEKDWGKEKKGWGISELFVELGLYYNQLKRYFDVFPKEQIKILFFDDLKLNPQNVVDECCEFLELKHFELENKKAFNVKETPANKGLNYLLTQTGLKSLLREILPKSARDKLSKRFYKESKTKLAKEDFYFLLEFYKDDINKTASLLNKDLSHWLNYSVV